MYSYETEIARLKSQLDGVLLEKKLQETQKEQHAAQLHEIKTYMEKLRQDLNTNTQTYTIKIDELEKINKMREKDINSFRKQIETQKQELNNLQTALKNEQTKNQECEKEK